LEESAVLFFLGILLVVAVAVAWHDLTQRKHAILRNFPVVGHFRYWLESVGPELRQYIVTDNNEERPFSRDHRRWVYASAKLEDNYFGFGSDHELESSPNYPVIKHSAFPLQSPYHGDRRALQPADARGSGAGAPADPRDRDQAQSGREAGARRGAATAEDHARDRGDPRRA